MKLDCISVDGIGDEGVKATPMLSSKQKKTETTKASFVKAEADLKKVKRESTDESGRKDPELVDLARKGDKIAFRELVERHQSRAFGIAYEILRSKEDAEDVVQESFVKAYLSLSAFRGQSAFYTWLYRIVYNMSIDFKRRQNRKGGRPMELHESALNNQYDSASKIMGAVTDPDGELARKEVRKRLRAAMDDLSEEHRAVITLREFEGMNYDEIAKTTGVSKGTVMSRLHYARKRLTEALKELQDDGPAEQGTNLGDEQESLKEPGNTLTDQQDRSERI